MIPKPVNWVLVNRFCEITGYTVDAVDKKRSEGVWLEGAIWRKAPDGRIQINIPEYEAWVEGKVSAPQADRVSRSRSNTVVRAVARS